MKQNNFSFLETLNNIDDNFILEASKNQIFSECSSDNPPVTTAFPKFHYRKSKRKLWILAAAAVMVCAGTVIAAKQNGLIQFFDQQFVSQEAQDQISTSIPTIITGPEHIPTAYTEENTMDIWNSYPELPDNSALLTIQEAMFDGNELYIYAAATDNGKKYELNADRLYINDEEYGPVSTATSEEIFEENSDKESDAEFQKTSGDYYFSINLSDLDLSGTFTVTLPLSVYDASGTRYQNQELTFEMNADATDITTLSSEVTFEHDEFNLTIKECRISASTLTLIVEYQRTDSLIESSTNPVMTLLSEDGTELEFYNASGGDNSGELIRQEYTYTGFTQKPENLIIGTRLVPQGEYINQCPIVYQDELEIK